jgi:peptidoglycan/LPS O-acetylase OafA/YrhL
VANRFGSLDGLRGVAALIVVAFHFLSAFTPSVVPDQSSTVPWWADSPIGLLFNGTFAVPVFFVLSGFVLAHSSKKLRDRLVLDMALRYLRLALPATASILMAWVLLSVFPTATQVLGSVVPGPWLAWTYQGEIPGVFAALKDGAVDVFWTGGSQFNNVLWTMRTELLGSFGVYLFFQFVQRRRIEVGAAALAALVLTRCNPGYVAFGLGSMLYLVQSEGFVPRRLLVQILFLCGLLIGSWSTGFAQRHGLLHLPAAIEPGNKHALWYPLGALFVVAGVLFSPPLQRIFSSRICLFLGRISFPLYLVHVPLIYTVVAFSAVSFGLTRGSGLFALACAALVGGVCIALLFERYIDQPAMALIKRLRRTSQ